MAQKKRNSIQFKGKNFTVNASVGKTFNMGNFESVRMDIGVGSDVEVGDDPVEVLASNQEALVEIFNANGSTVLKSLDGTQKGK